MVSSRSFVKASVVLVGGYVAYRGILSFLRNGVTLSITEVVRLPTQDAAKDADEQPTVHGEIQCETYLMRSYRLVLKLSVPLKVSPSALSSEARSRHRVLHISDDGTYSNTMSSQPRAGKDLPDIVVEEAHNMIDHWQLVSNGTIHFTPACVGDEMLLRYTGTLSKTCKPNVVVRDCHTEALDTPGLKRLSFNLVVYNMVHMVTVAVKLPNSNSRIVSVYHNNLGDVKREETPKPHHVLWQIPIIDSKTAGSIKSENEGGLAGNGPVIVSEQEGELHLNARGYLVDSTEFLGDQECASDYRKLYATTQRHGDDGYVGEDYMLSARFVLIFEEAIRNNEVKGSLSGDGTFSEDGDQGSSCVAGSCSRKSQKREARAAKKELRRRKLDFIRSGGANASEGSVALSVTYSVSQLASGLSVRKLQTLSDRVNWKPRSRLEYWLFGVLIPFVYQRPLEKFAHYTTYFVHSINVK
ncbi:hypothetical protein ERJ75_000936900 [Trypanosoma vivax]|nr:hypothetical protein ERJ75_000936900 [Trypanosoma vivax]